MAEKRLVAATDLGRYLAYNSDGTLTWLPRRPADFPDGKQRSPQARCTGWNKNFAGTQAGTARDGRGYFVVSLFGTQHAVHRVVWAMHAGQWPAEQVDHIDGAAGFDVGTFEHGNAVAGIAGGLRDAIAGDLDAVEIAGRIIGDCLRREH